MRPGDHPPVEIVYLLEARRDRAAGCRRGSETMPIRFSALGLTVAALFAVALPAGAQETRADEAPRSEQELRTQNRERARTHVDGTQSQRVREENRVNQRTRAGAGSEQAKGERSQRQDRAGSAESAGRDMSRSQARDMSRSRAPDAARTRSRQHRTAP